MYIMWAVSTILIFMQISYLDRSFCKQLLLQNLYVYDMIIGEQCNGTNLDQTNKRLCFAERSHSAALCDDSTLGNVGFSSNYV